MLDAAFVRDNLALVKANCVNRGVTADVDAAVRLDDERKRLQQEKDALQAKQNQITDQIKSAGKDKEKREALVAESRALKEPIAKLDAELKRAEEARDAALRLLPNMTHPDAPGRSHRRRQQGAGHVRRTAQVRLQTQRPR
jgi:seryl-tRNA synthetase